MDSTKSKQEASGWRSILTLIGIVAAIAVAYFIFPGPQMRANTQRIEAEKRAAEAELAAKERRKKQFDADQAAFKSADYETLAELVRDCRQLIIDKVSRGSSFPVYVQRYSPRELRRLGDAMGAGHNGILAVDQSFALDNHIVDIEKFNIEYLKEEGVVNPIIQMAVEHAEDESLRRYSAIYFCSIEGMKLNDLHLSKKYYFRG